jgi:hypothetical protein
MKNETPEQRAQNKANYIARATSHFDSPKIRKEAAEQWEAANPISSNEN